MTLEVGGMNRWLTGQRGRSRPDQARLKSILERELISSTIPFGAISWRHTIALSVRRVRGYSILR